MVFVETTDSCSFLFPNAEVGEDGAEDVVWGDFTGDLAQIVHCLADVLAYEVAAEAVTQAVDGALYCLPGAAQGGVVAGIGHYHFVGIVLRQCGQGADALLQGVDADGALGRALQ